MSHRYLNRAVLSLSLAVAACGGKPSEELADAGASDVGDDPYAKPADCPMTRTIEGTIGGVAVDATDYEQDTMWFNSSLEEQALNALDREAMKRVGLDPDDDADVRRYRYFFQAADLRVLFGEWLNESFTNPELGRDLSVFLFDVGATDTQPGDPIAVYDVSILEALRAPSKREQLGAMLRILIDDMQRNGHADAVVAFAPDRSDEGLFVYLVNLFGENTRFATSGTASFDDVYYGARALETIEYPFDATSISVHVDAKVGDEPLKVEVLCSSIQVAN